MKKSELRKIIRQLVKEQASMQTTGSLGGVGGGSPDPTMSAYNNLRNPRSLMDLGQALINNGTDPGKVNSAIKGAMRKYNIGANEPINPSELPVWLPWVLRAVLYGGGGAVIGNAIGL